MFYVQTSMHYLWYKNATGIRSILVVCVIVCLQTIGMFEVTKKVMFEQLSPVCEMAEAKERRKRTYIGLNQCCSYWVFCLRTTLY